MKTNYLNSFKREMTENGWTVTSETKPDTGKVKYIECDCGSEILRIEKDDEVSYMLAIYNYGKYRRSLWTRIKWAWKMLTRDEVFGDQIILSEEKAKELSKFIENE